MKKTIHRQENEKLYGPLPLEDVGDKKDIDILIVFWEHLTKCF